MNQEELGENAQDGTTLISGGELKEDDKLVSANGHFELIMQDDGNLVVYRVEDNHPLWASRTVAHRDREFLDQREFLVRMKESGDLVVFHGESEMWHSDTNSDDGAFLVMQNDGDLVIYSNSGQALWFASKDCAADATFYEEKTLSEKATLVSGGKLEEEDKLVSANGLFELIMQDDGNLVVYRVEDNHPLWASRTVAHRDREFLDQREFLVRMKESGDLVVFHGESEMWHSDTNSDEGAFLVMQDDGDLVIFSHSREALWSASKDCAADSSFYEKKTLITGGKLQENDKLLSANRLFKLIMQDDGNLVLYRVEDNHPIWASRTVAYWGRTCEDDRKYYARMNESGDLAVFHGESEVWHSDTNSDDGAFLVVQDDGDLVIYSNSGEALWWASKDCAADSEFYSGTS